MLPMARTLTALTLLAFLGCASEQLPHTLSIENPLISYEDVGEGPPVVFVHGFSQTHEAWQKTPVYNDLLPDYRLISVDLRGHGDSPKPHDPQRYGKHMAEDLVRVLDELEIERAHFVGFSMGASIVGNLLTLNPERIRTATLGSGFFTRWDELEEDFATYTEERGELGERFPWEPPNQDFKALSAAIRGTRFAEVPDHQIASVAIPTIVCFGSLEVEAMMPEQRRQLDTLPSSMRLLTIDGADHDSEKAAILTSEFTAAVRDLIESY